ncbi:MULTISPECIES: protein-disulfide reductase DsbD [unclassified Pseudomonas]|uniref:protein-disulfide reductase DsbD family protein n=1 Tax=unclassified Pseudomonas TaxID=196821 RepID=UPI000BC4F66C|nr:MULTISPECIES: thioredoxin family protein [unclassified Pseudomonas]PVZ19767.1 thiol:disulfide interchange protein DsbD [Pseudomonas sp. URIL14HWK12:I12]PVZ26833.1 thiol:disulfide interchange protein DsbD [Pseudomonas sp. URIL14HWK12:I10]PVZ37722.1 thiol:disulfide interchange protein DsbD [Pseudomonas sp. URIL14HWK12:I11]SNZ05929.1 thiol:disulfide interchange protein DsbD [Pseudomonas sp. URIL14HWK12:I9]
MLSAVFAAFLGGLILNAMPCVFPIISLKALGLVRHVHHRRQARVEGLAFLAGVVLTMLALGGMLLAIRAAGVAAGWGFQLQSPLVVALLALVMLAAALNLFGVFEVGLAAQRLGGAAPDRAGPLGAALTGALAIVVATPCSAPFMAGALGYALVQPAAQAMVVFGALALGFAAPFTLLAWAPGLARVLPRPGPWMATFKQVLAFPMLGAAAWLAWVLALQAGDGALGSLLGAAVAVGFAAWLHGRAQRRQLLGMRHWSLSAMAGLVVLALALPLGSLPRTTATPATTEVARGTWSPQAVAAERGKGHPIFVNFTAAWCVTCQVNERVALSQDAVKQAMARTGTHYLIADSTQFNADVDDAINQFGQGGLPLYVLYPADGGEPQVLPQVLTVTTVVAALERAAASH